MSSDRRFFILREPFPATEIGSLLGRIVTSKTSPLDCFAPHISPGVPPHNTDDIIPSLLVEPKVETEFVDRIVSTTKRDINGQVSAIFSAELHSYKEHGLGIECDELRRYSLPNANQVFQTLMANEHYAADVRAILERAWPRHAYLVTGFVVAVNPKWTSESTVERGGGTQAKVSIADLVGLPGVPDCEIGGGASAASSNSRYRESKTAGEEVIALSYSSAKLTYSFAMTAQFVTKKFEIGAPMRTKPHHLSMGDEEEEDFVDWDSADEDGSESHADWQCGSSHRQPTGVIIESDVEEGTPFPCLVKRAMG